MKDFDEREFDPVTGEQIENHAWQKIDGEWVRGHRLAEDCWCAPVFNPLTGGWTHQL
jgi:hypothetical protein